MASTSSGKTPKGILKQTNSLEDQSVEVHFDEMNILQTYHPANKDYGHMKINEPPTPYSYSCEDSDTESNEKLDPKKLAEKMQNVEPTSKHESYDRNESSSDEDTDLTEEERKSRKVFKDKRKKHYNEFGNVKLARDLIAKELAELEDDD